MKCTIFIDWKTLKDSISKITILPKSNYNSKESKSVKFCET